MGQKAAKQPIRVVLPADDSDGVAPDGDDDEEEHNIDKLGVSAQEIDYPEPKPPLQETTVKDQSHRTDISAKDEHKKSFDKIDEEGTIFSTKDLPEEEYQVELVPVGASFQKIVQKRIEVNTDLESIDEGGKKSYPVVRTIARSLSLRNSLIGSGLASSSGFPTGMTKREAMLAERERHEYLNLMAPKAGGGETRRGQFRRYHFDSIAGSTHHVTTEKFRSVEDRVADEEAEKHRDHRAETYDSLIKDLIAAINSERLKVKIILAWMSKQSIGRLQFGPKLPSPDTPNGYMMLIQEGQGTFPVFFALLCRAAKLKCAIISGISKGTHYEVGSKDTELLRNTWNAVYVEGSWQLVHPLWVCKGVAYRQLGGWLKIEEEGKSKRKLSVATLGRDVPSFNPYFIFTKPEEFVYRNFPDEERWQLLQTPLTLEEFLEQAYIRPIFFMNSFKLKSENSCVIASENGTPCEIKIDFPKQKSSDVVFGYDLSMKVEKEINANHEMNGKEIIADGNAKERSDINEMNENQSNAYENAKKRSDINEMNENQNNAHGNNQNTDEDKENGKRCVMVKKSEGSVTFEVRFFKDGTYKLRLYGGYFKEFGNKPPWIIDVLLTCKNVTPDLDPLPFDPGSVGWGPGPISESVGLYVPSHVESDVHLTEEEDTIIYFILHHRVKVKASLHHCKIASENLQEFVETECIVIGDITTLQIRLMHPGQGEYGLQINVRHHRMDVNACNYIVKTSTKRPFETFYPRRARRMILNAMETCDIDFLKGALDECERTGIPDTDPDVMGARNRFEFLSCKTELYVALLVNRIDVSEHALYRTRKAKLDILLANEMIKVEEHLQKLIKLDEGGWTCDIPEIDRQSLVELSELRKPKLEVRLVITAMYMLLGVEEDNLKDWKKVRKFLRNQQSTLIEIARLEKYLMLNTTIDVTVSGSVLERVSEILANYTVDNIRRIDNTAAAYFQWVTSVAGRLIDNQIKQEPKGSIKGSDVKSTISGVKGPRTSTAVKIQDKINPKMQVKPPIKSNIVTSKNNVKVESTLDIRSLKTTAHTPSQIIQTTENPTRLSQRIGDRTSENKLASNKDTGSVTKSELTVTNKSIASAQSKKSRTESHYNALQNSKGNTDILTVRSLTNNLKSDDARSQASVIVVDKSKRSTVSSQNTLVSSQARVSNRPDLLSTRSETFVQNSVKSVDRKSIDRKGSNVTTKTVQSVTSINKGNRHGVIDVSLKDDISGKTFFSEGKKSQRNLDTGQVSRQGSKRQN